MAELPNAIPTRYDHTREPDIYQAWLKSGQFQPTGQGEPYSMVLPPPNVTGDLHLGHALTYGLEDTIARHRRRLGQDVLVLPGMDHAAIAVEALITKKIQKEKGQTRNQLGREKFLEEVWAWINYYMPRMRASLERLGLSADWDRFRFTMDEHSQLAVRTAFVELYEKGLIYRGEYIVNWDAKLQTAISDDEVLYEDRPSHLCWIKYGPITVATTRPETQFGDVAIAVHPNDARYKEFVGTEISVLMADGVQRPLKVVADDFVDPKFGTGAVKITPAHDPNDFEAAERHQLPFIQTIDKYGKLTEAAGEFAGLKVEEARAAVVKKLQEMNLLEKIQDYTVRTPVSERSGAVVEPLISLQWFLKTTALRDQALKVVRDGQIKFHPKNLEKVYFHWLENLHDWCISRQLWWGHQLPVWHCQNWAKIKDQKSKINYVVAMKKPKTCPICGECEMVQELDTLDTWFSSGLWPFATLGWPLDKTRGEPLDNDRHKSNGTSDLERYFPTNLLETSQDILFFWVARMIMLSLALTDQIPFKDVYFHGLILDEHGQKMSKSKGNVLDPLVLIDKYGADALRMSLIGANSAGTAQRFSEQKVLKYRNFVTKIWNASRYVAMLLAQKSAVLSKDQLEPDEFETQFLKKLQTIETHNQALFEQFKFGIALEELYEFFWFEFADKFLEYEKKIVVADPTSPAAARAHMLLSESLQRLLALLSDFAPFVAQAITDQMSF